MPLPPGLRSRNPKTPAVTTTHASPMPAPLSSTIQEGAALRNATQRATSPHKGTMGSQGASANGAGGTSANPASGTAEGTSGPQPSNDTPQPVLESVPGSSGTGVQFSRSDHVHALGPLDAVYVSYSNAVSGISAATVQSAIDALEAQIAAIQTGGGTDGKISGLDVISLSRTSYQYAITPGVYSVQGTSYTLSSQVTETLANADPTYNRFDIIYGDTSAGAGIAHIGALTGTPGATALPPDLSPSQVALSDPILVTAASSGPPSNVLLTLYDEGASGEWTGSVTATRILVGDTSDYYTGTKEIKYAAAVNNDRLTLTAPSGVAYTSGANQSLVLAVKCFSLMQSNMSLRFRFGTPSGYTGNFVDMKPGAFGFSGAEGAWQYPISLNLTQFGQVTGATRIVAQIVTITGAGSPVTIGIDDVQIVSTAGGGSSVYTLPPATATTLGGVKIGSGITEAADGTISVTPTAALTRYRYEAAGDGTTTAFTLPHLAPSSAYVDPYAGGVIVKTTSSNNVNGWSYNAATGVVTFGLAPANGTEIVITYWA